MRLTLYSAYESLGPWREEVSVRHLPIHLCELPRLLDQPLMDGRAAQPTFSSL